MPCLVLLGVIGLLASALPAPASDKDGHEPYTEFTRAPGEQGSPYGKGIVILIRGGGWGEGKNLVEAARSEVPRYTERGWSVRNVTHHTGRRSVADVLGYVKEARAQVGPRRPVCLWGNSSGAHLAALAATLTDVDCVAVEGVPAMIKTQAELDRIGKSEPRYLEYWGDTPEEWRVWSPVTYANGGVFPGKPPISTTGLKGKVLVGTVPDDLATPPADAELLRRANPAQVEHRELRPGSCRFAHTGAACAEKKAFYAREGELMRAAARRRAGSG